MPRLVGKQSDTGANVMVLLVLAAIVGVVLEYVGVINVIPGFGREGRYNPLQSQVSHTHMMADSSH